MISRLVISRICRGRVGTVARMINDGEPSRAPQDPHDLIIGDGDEEKRQSIEQGKFDQLAIKVCLVVPAGLTLGKVDCVDRQVAALPGLQHD